ncbi:PTS system ascorbate-specific IIA component (L-Asc family) [Mesocricetibacter intestinalis]|uniref:Ascorbate-specific PTS system EIIA component n=1 Tax=Mesocricetibacter intestinalis TaxID=1521930 RepID=A0A4R6VEG8_9PAST|nr:PTS sugar transporter subunit IIA [Mesocricetibacter intestinalis]TDQ59375.1 PTS system ascorbate-specific IIA component (L-Asc family) [Mesocricetibacter intestinalis]
MLKESLLENDSIKLNQQAADWRQAIKIGTDLLVDSGAVEPRYYEAIVRMIEQMGPYIILAPGLAMPHARPENGVLKTAFALVTLKQPVWFEGADEPVSVLLTLAGSDAETHLEGIVEITRIFDDPEADSGVNIDKFLACNSKQEVLQVIEQALEN